MKFGALFGYVFNNSIKLTVYDPSKKYEVFYPENDFDDIFQFSNYDVLGVHCKGEYLSIEIAHNNYVNGGQLNETAEAVNCEWQTDDDRL